jgi:ABC-type transporter Mla maintaining outer membrane lipid asymmetry ATPase subunit MlaF
MPDKLVRLELARPQRAAAMADVACGCLAPRKGRVTFPRRNRRDQPAKTADALRGRIDLLFGAEPWLPWMTIADNALLAQLYHTRLPRPALRANAARLAHQAGSADLLAAAEAEQRRLVAR